MKTDQVTADVIPEKTPFGKVMGIVDTHAQLQAISAALLTLGVQKVEVLSGGSGIRDLDQEKDAVAGFFMGDMESEMMKRYLEAVKNGMVVFAAIVKSESVAEAAEVLKANGAAEVVHFGTWVITNY